MLFSCLEFHLNAAASGVEQNRSIWGRKETSGEGARVNLDSSVQWAEQTRPHKGFERWKDPIAPAGVGFGRHQP